MVEDQGQVEQGRRLNDGRSACGVVDVVVSHRGDRGGYTQHGVVTAWNGGFIHSAQDHDSNHSHVLKHALDIIRYYYHAMPSLSFTRSTQTHPVPPSPSISFKYLSHVPITPS